MRPYIGRHDMTPRPLRRRRDGGVERDGDESVVGLGRHIRDRHRDGVFPGIAALKTSSVGGCVRLGVVLVRDGGVRVRRGAVVVLGVIVVGVGVDVLQAGRPRGRHHDSDEHTSKNAHR